MTRLDQQPNLDGVVEASRLVIPGLGSAFARHGRVEQLLLPQIGDAAAADMLHKQFATARRHARCAPSRAAIPTATAIQVIMFAPAAIMRWIATSWASIEMPPDASVTTVTSQPSPRAWIVGIATQTSVHRPAMISCLRPVALTTSTTFSSCQVLTKVRSITSWSGKYVGDLREDEATASRDHAGQNGRNIEGLCQLRQRRRIVDHHLRVVAVQVGELIGLVVDQNEDRVFGTKKRIEAVTKGH